MRQWRWLGVAAIVSAGTVLFLFAGARPLKAVIYAAGWTFGAWLMWQRKGR